jgi:predicted ABC-type transport system involved in lysophospholipase L1 biosynthesis ATPase subunit
VNGTVTVDATIESTAGTQDVLFALDPVGNVDDPAAEAVAESTDDAERDIRAYELTVAFDPVGGGLR